jgi:hypothetical protein
MSRSAGLFTVITTSDPLRRITCMPVRSSLSASLTLDVLPGAGHSHESSRYPPPGAAQTVYVSAGRLSAAKLPSEPVLADPVIVGEEQTGVPCGYDGTQTG